ncbi:hypothetical protein CEXT_227801 [Caerostris extrusa]|uniref:Uncharacterized protein n=1 Tax=Caerostris extrusa TaxID=172846 RepID=A0AAV4NJB1_CAEEX|nr:hypothetical protein CEXT_227801 [Caerostris extrusa]
MAECFAFGTTGFGYDSVTPYIEREADGDPAHHAVMQFLDKHDVDIDYCENRYQKIFEIPFDRNFNKFHLIEYIRNCIKISHSVIRKTPVRFNEIFPKIFEVLHQLLKLLRIYRTPYKTSKEFISTFSLIELPTSAADEQQRISRVINVHVVRAIRELGLNSCHKRHLHLKSSITKRCGLGTSCGLALGCN